MSQPDFPLHPPRDWFETPESDGPQPLAVAGDGRVSGHLAPWNGCHSSFQECLTPPRSPDGYQTFHVGQLETAEGDMIPVGKIVYNGKHAPLSLALAAATQHYDDNGHVGAYVRATDGRHGIWLAGAVKHDISPEGLRDLRANPPSGDWRQRNGRYTLVAALAVPVPGYPIGRAASGPEAVALILSYPEESIMTEPRSKEFLRQRALVASGLVAAPLTTTRRNNLPNSVFAIPETRSYPIHDRSHAADALARASGKPEEGRVRRAVCRKYPDMGECASK